MSGSIDPQEYNAFYFSDFWNHLRFSKKKALFFMLASLLCFLVSLFFSPPRYKIEALFHESSDKKTLPENFLGDVVFSSLNLPSKEGSQAVSMMRSFRILQRVVEKLGLQVQQPSEEQGHLFENFSEHFKVALNLPLQDRDHFSFSRVSFKEEVPASYFLSFSSKDSFAVIDRGGKEVAKGRVGKEVVLESLRFTLLAPLKKVILEKNYPFTFVPWVSCAENLLRKIAIVPQKGNASFLRLTYHDRDRVLGARILNQVMEEYALYLKEENEKLCQEQISYLEERQEYLVGQMDKTLQEQVSYLENNLGAKGFISLEHEIDTLFPSQQEYGRKLSDLDLAINLLQKKETAIGKEAPQILERIEELKRERDPLDFSLQSQRKEKILSRATTPLCLDEQEKVHQRLKEVNEQLFSLQEQKSTHPSSFLKGGFKSNEMESLKKMADQCALEKERIEHGLLSFHEVEKRALPLEMLRQKKKEILILIDELKKEKPSQEMPLTSPDLKKIFELWKSSSGKEEEIKKTRKEDCLFYLDHLSHLLSIEEKMIQEGQMVSFDSASPEASWNLADAKKNFLDHAEELEKTKTKRLELVRLQQELLNPQFEISSLSSFFNDAVTGEIIQKASALSLHLHDEKNYAPIERARFQEELMVQKSFLGQHIQELAQRERLRETLLEEKLHSLQKVLLDLLNQEIAILEQQAEEQIDLKIEGLQEEKRLLSAKLSDLKEEMSDLPKKWKKEKELKFKTEMGLKTIETLSDFIESKILLLHLHQVASKPIDFASLPLKPENNRLFLSLIGAVLFGGFLGVLFAFFQGMLKGFAVSEESLSGFGFLTSGLLSFAAGEKKFQELGQEDWECLRKTVSLLEEKKESPSIISLLLNQGPNFASILADLLSRKGKKVLLIDTSFTANPSEKKGFIHYLAKELKACPIEKGTHFDFLSSGGENSYAIEILGSLSFREMILALQKNYDAILLYNKAPLKSMSAQVLLSFSDFLVVTYQKETLLELKPFTDWANCGNKNKLVFVGVKNKD